MNKYSKRLFMVGLIFNLITFLFFEVVQASPPSRVARLSYLKGGVSFSPAGESNWFQVGRNRPLTRGDRLWVPKRGSAELQLGGASLCLGSLTGISILNLDHRIGQFKLSEGSLVLNIPFIKSNQSYEVDTPNLAFLARKKGSYKVHVNLKNKTTTISVLRGQAEVYGEKGKANLIEEGESYLFYGRDLKNYEHLKMNAKEFYGVCNQSTPLVKKLKTARYVSPEMIGYEDLDHYGEWITLQDYGSVWKPHRVRFDWAPYRFGHWEWINPWGWTWIDDEPWGFAPFHYGRWVFVKKSWYWIPGLKEKSPVYAPALVVFMKGNHFGSASAGVGWIPLGSNEVYRPPYEVNQDYFVNVNASNVTTVNTTNISNVYHQKITNITYANKDVPNAVTAVPATAFVEGKSVEKNKISVPQGTIDKTQVAPAPSITHTKESMTGAAKPSTSQPPEKVLEQTVVAKTAPPEPLPEQTKSNIASDKGSGSEEVKPSQPVIPSENVKVISPEVVTPIEKLESVHPLQDKPKTEPVIQVPNEKPEEKLKQPAPQLEKSPDSTQLNQHEDLQNRKLVEPTVEIQEKPKQMEKPEEVAPKLEASSEKDLPVEPVTPTSPKENISVETNEKPAEMPEITAPRPEFSEPHMERDSQIGPSVQVPPKENAVEELKSPNLEENVSPAKTHVPSEVAPPPPAPIETSPEEVVVPPAPIETPPAPSKEIEPHSPPMIPKVEVPQPSSEPDDQPASPEANSAEQAPPAEVIP